MITAVIAVVIGINGIFVLAALVNWAMDRIATFLYDRRR